MAKPPREQPKRFEDYFSDPDAEAKVTDAELDALMAGAMGGPPADVHVDELEPGTVIEGTVIGERDGEVLVELDSKTLGALAPGELEGEPMPAVGTRLKAEYRRFDRKRGLALLARRAVREKIFWEEVRHGTRGSGTVTGTTRGGLVLDFGGVRAFMPISEIDIPSPPAEALGAFMGARFECEVIEYDRGAQNLVVGRRRMLDEARAGERSRVIQRLQVGAVVTGRVRRRNEHGAFVDVGGIDGLLHASKIHRFEREHRGRPPLAEGDSVAVEIIHVDAAAGRIGLDFAKEHADAWQDLAGGYAPGDEISVLVLDAADGGSRVLLEEGVEGWLRPGRGRRTAAPAKGTVVPAVVESVDPGARRIVLGPAKEDA